MRKQSIEIKIRNIISREILIDGDTIPSNKPLLSLPVDQDDWSCLLIPTLIEEFNLNVESSEWQSVETINDISDLINFHLSKQSNE